MKDRLSGGSSSSDSSSQSRLKETRNKSLQLFPRVGSLSSVSSWNELLLVLLKALVKGKAQKAERGHAILTKNLNGGQGGLMGKCAQGTDCQALGLHQFPQA